MKQRLMKTQKRTYLMLGAAALLLLLGWLLPVPNAFKLILFILSFVCSLLELLGPIFQDLRAKDWTSRRFFLALAGVLSLCTGAAGAAALMLLVYRAGALVLEYRRQHTLELLHTRRSLSPLADRLADYAPQPAISGRVETLLHAWLPYGILLLAAVTAALTALWGGGAAAGLRRAAVVLALAEEAALFAAYGLCDHASVICAAEHGVLFTGDSLPRLLDTRLVCVNVQEGTQVRGALCFAADPQSISGDALLLLAAHAWSNSRTPLAGTLRKLYGKPIDHTAVLETEDLAGYGVAAEVRGMVVISGSAELMSKGGLPMVPFRDGDQAVHLGVNGRYAGCIMLDDKTVSDDHPEAQVAALRMYRFRDEDEAVKKRQPGETLLYAADGAGRGPVQTGDVYAAIGGYGQAEVSTQKRGRAGVSALLTQCKGAKLMRQGCFLLTGTVKCLALLLALFGWCPLWLAVLLESAAVGFTYSYAVRALDYKD